MPHLTLIRLAFISALALASSASIVSAEQIDELREQTRLAWDKFLKDNCHDGMPEQAVRKLMEGKHRDIGFNRANDETYGILFLIDDYHQVGFIFKSDSKLMVTPFAERRGQWIRSPDGNTVSILEPAEAEARTKIEDAAITFVAKKYGYEPKSLEVYLRRAETKHEWCAIVTHDILQVDPPTFVLEISADGTVTKSTW